MPTIADLDKLVRLTKAQVKPASGMLARAFQDDPLMAYFFPDASERENKSPHIFEFMLRYGVLYGEVYATSPDLEGVAVWLPSGKVGMTLWRMVRSGDFSILFKLGMKSLRRQLTYSDYASLIRRRHTPFRHWFLQSIGIDPAFQGKGYAGTLLKAMFARLDREHLPCYLDTEKEENVSIYQHYGFKVVEEVILPGTEISHWAMLREKSG